MATLFERKDLELLLRTKNGLRVREKVAANDSDYGLTLRIQTSRWTIAVLPRKIAGDFSVPSGPG